MESRAAPAPRPGPVAPHAWRGITLREIQGAGVTICDLNGINLIHLLKRWEPDHEVLSALADAGFTQINMPFESGNLRIIRKYASAAGVAALASHRRTPDRPRRAAAP